MTQSLGDSYVSQIGFDFLERWKDGTAYIAFLNHGFRDSRSNANLVEGDIYKTWNGEDG